jgi:tetratricopeptide (TPR) repeat protein
MLAAREVEQLLYKGKKSFVKGFASRDFTLATDRFHKLLAIDPTNGEAHRILGLIYKIMGEHELALRHLERAIFYYNKDVEAYVLLGQIKGDVYYRHDEAIEFLNKALAIRPTHCLALQRRGWNKGAQGKHGAAIMDLNAALKYGHSLDHEDEGKTYFYLGENKTKLGHYKEAVSDFTIALPYNPNNVKIHSGLGVCKLMQKKYDEALVHLKKAIELDPLNKEARQNLFQVQQTMTLNKLQVSASGEDNNHLPQKHA